MVFLRVPTYRKEHQSVKETVGLNFAREYGLIEGALSTNAPKEWVIRDPVHGYIEPSQQEIDVIDQLAFQRLRGIKQLANTFLVFPGATHTRFEHSYGTMFVASQMVSRVDSLKGEKEKERQIRLAALLHDLGHGPFSHVSEDIVARTIVEK